MGTSGEGDRPERHRLRGETIDSPAVVGVTTFDVHRTVTAQMWGMGALHWVDLDERVTVFGIAGCRVRTPSASRGVEPCGVIETPLPAATSGSRRASTIPRASWRIDRTGHSAREKTVRWLRCALSGVLEAGATSRTRSRSLPPPIGLSRPLTRS